ncbi:MAG: hypothetical protein ABIU09_09125 [Pyrinomonadaceae bacterium]
MKKFLAGTLLLFVFAIALPIASYAQSCNRRSYRGNSSNYGYAYNNGYNERRGYNRRSYNRRRSSDYGNAYYPVNNRRDYDRGYYQPDGYYTEQRRPSFYRRHRNLVNIGIGTGAGALLGGLIGGRRGIGWGALAGGGSSALYTYKIRPKQRRYYR